METLEEELGYHVHYRVMDSVSYVPQHRERIYIVGFKDNLKFSFPEPDNQNKPALKDILEYKKDFCQEGLPTIGFLFYRDEWVWKDLTYQDALIEEIERQGMNAVAVFSNGLPDESLGQLSLNNVFAKYFSVCGLPAISTDCKYGPREILSENHICETNNIDFTVSSIPFS